MRQYRLSVTEAGRKNASTTECARYRIWSPAKHLLLPWDGASWGDVIYKKSSCQKLTYIIRSDREIVPLPRRQRDAYWERPDDYHHQYHLKDDRWSLIFLVCSLISDSPSTWSQCFCTAAAGWPPCTDPPRWRRSSPARRFFNRRPFGNVSARCALLAHRIVWKTSPCQNTTHHTAGTEGHVRSHPQVAQEVPEDPLSEMLLFLQSFVLDTKIQIAQR